MTRKLGKLGKLVRQFCALSFIALLAVAGTARAEELPDIDSSYFAVVWVDLEKTDAPSLRQAAAACLSPGGVKTTEPALAAWAAFHDGMTANAATRLRFAAHGYEGVPYVSWQILVSSTDPKKYASINSIFERMNSSYFGKPAYLMGHPNTMICGDIGVAEESNPDLAQRQAFADAAASLPPGAALSVAVVQNPCVKSVAADVARRGPASFRRLVMLAAGSRAMTGAVMLGADPRVELRILAKDDAAAQQIKQAAQAAAAEAARLKSADSSDQLLNRFISQLVPTVDRSSVQFTIKASALTPADAALLPTAKAARDFYLDLEVAKHMREVLKGPYAYAAADVRGGKMPARLEDCLTYYDHPTFAEAMFNPRTGEKNGFIYVRSAPTEQQLRMNSPVCYEAKNGVRDPNGLVLYRSDVVSRGVPKR